jgi:hypothetical protein
MPLFDFVSPPRGTANFAEIVSGFGGFPNKNLTGSAFALPVKLRAWVPPGTLPIGYQIDADQHFQIDPLTAPFVLEAFKKYDEGATMTEIRDWLNEQGLKNTRGQPLSYNSVGHLLHNRRYIGEFSYRDVVVPDGIPAIVPQDLFDRVQEKLEKNRKAPARHKAEEDYLLTTKLFCGYCGLPLRREWHQPYRGHPPLLQVCVREKAPGLSQKVCPQGMDRRFCGE